MRLVVLASLLFGLLVYGILPSQVIVLNDDFGYLRSVVETLQYGRPWTNDWLEPWAASFSSLSALLYLGTSSFTFATHGLLAGLAACSFGASCALLIRRGFTPGAAIGLAAVLMTFPTVMWKTFEFTSVALYLPCLLGAIWCAERKYFGRFLLFWGLALAARQSALVWMVFPGMAFLGALLSRNQPGVAGWHRPALITLGGLLLYSALNLGMNKTHAQTLITDHALADFSLNRALAALGIGATVFCLAAGLGAYVLQLREPRVRWRPFPVLFLISLIGLALLATDRHSWIGIEHSGFSGKSGGLYLKLLVILPAVGFMAQGYVLRPPLVLWALASLLLVSVRQDIMDYYLLDAGLLGFFAVVRPVNATSRAGPTVPWPAILRLVPLGLFLSFNLRLVFDLKTTFDRVGILTKISENALRREALRVEDLSFMPFGYYAWHLYPYFITHDGRHDPDIAGMIHYLRVRAIAVTASYSPALQAFSNLKDAKPDANGPLVAHGGGTFLWLFRADYQLTGAPPEKVYQPALSISDDFKPQPFPLNDAEWTDLINGADIVEQVK